MSNEKFNGHPDNWFDSLTDASNTDAEIGADEQAVASYDMADLSDIELEKIIQEAMAEEWDLNDDILSEPEAEAYPEEEITDPAEDMPPQDTEEYEEEVTRKVRPKRKGGYGLFGLPHLVSTAIWAGLILFIGISLGRVLWLCATDILAFGRQEKSVTITITETDDLNSITNKLHNAGLIKYPELFKMYAPSS